MCGGEDSDQQLGGVAVGRIFITGLAGGLGRATAESLLEGGHQVIVHARNAERLAAVRDLLDRGPPGVVGDLVQTHDVADQVNQGVSKRNEA